MRWSLFPDYVTAIAENLVNAANTSILGGNSSVDVLAAYRGFGSFWYRTAKEVVDWTFVIFSVERLLVTARPLSAALRQTDADAWRKTLAKECCILVLAVLFSLSHLVTYYYYYTNFYDSTLSYQDSLTPSLSRWYNLQITAQTGMSFAKWLLLLILNTALIIVLWKHQTSTNVTVTVNKRSSTRNANILVLASLTVYTLTQLPHVILECLKMASRPPYCSLSLTNEEVSHVSWFVDLLQLSNYSITFFVYFLSSPKFRRQCQVLCGKGVTSAQTDVACI
ncbi:uncharacterized protein LOC129595382 isoform X2 [Paramacrobiotus metropolitanus]|uniref:uncharacterized protein LOC129595382 isoform X2 n=1 Tax=Paramacrobiotus metropolitanus TaxID=2943436 RepID=UPI002445652C|nr:uncharacterized protein LOC129595382 isoform X2 [Paramacrobiotus metropolitanus]